MTFLELCNRVREETGVSAQGPASVAGQTGILAKVVSWVKAAEREVLAEATDWLFLHGAKSVTLPTSDNVVSLASEGFPAIAKVIKITTEHGRPVGRIGKSTWIDGAHLYENQQTAPEPSVVRIDPETQALYFWPRLQAPMILTIHFYREGSPMAANADVSDVPARYHEAIVNRALMFYGDYEEDIHRYNRASTDYDHWLRRLCSEQLPEIKIIRGTLG